MKRTAREYILLDASRYRIPKGYKPRRAIEDCTLMSTVGSASQCFAVLRSASQALRYTPKAPSELEVQPFGAPQVCTPCAEQPKGVRGKG